MKKGEKLKIEVVDHGLSGWEWHHGHIYDVVVLDSHTYQVLVTENNTSQMKKASLKDYTQMEYMVDYYERGRAQITRDSARVYEPSNKGNLIMMKKDDLL